MFRLVFDAIPDIGWGVDNRRDEGCSLSDSTGTGGRFLQTRKVRRASGEPVPFFPSGGIPLIALGLLFLFALWPFAFGVVQSTAGRTAAEALIEADAAWARANVSGQWITLEGRPPSRDAAEAAVAAVRRARAPTLFGSARPVTRVRDAFDYTNLGEGNPATAIDWSFRVANGVLTLDGDMPDNSVRQQIVSAARAKIDPPRILSVQDSLSITQDAAPSGFFEVAQRGLNTVTRCDRGVAGFNDNRFSLSCELPGAEAAAVREMAIAPIPLGEVGAVDIIAHEAVATCESSLADLLGDTRIEFQSSSAVIGASSAGLLDSVAEAVRSCPGTLRIAGYTDSTGLPDMNRALSQARAEAVRNALIARGVPPGRLVATGYGDASPVASNTTPQGRAQNRRIEIRVIRVSE